MILKKHMKHVILKKHIIPLLTDKYGFSDKLSSTLLILAIN